MPDERTHSITTWTRLGKGCVSNNGKILSKWLLNALKVKKAGNLLLLLKMHFSFFSCIPQKWQTKLDHSFLQQKLLNKHARPIFLTAWFAIKWEIKKGCATLYLNFTLNVFTTDVCACNRMFLIQIFVGYVRKIQRSSKNLL